MAEKVNNQDIFLNKLRTDGTKVNVFLSNKTRLFGLIAGFDKYTLTLEFDNKQTLVYKNQIASITPHTQERPIKRVK